MMRERLPSSFRLMHQLFQVISLYVIMITAWTFRNVIRFMFLRWGVVSTSPNPQAGGPPLVGYPRLFIQYMRSYPPYCRPFLQPEHEDAPCRSDRVTLNTHYWQLSVADPTYRQVSTCKKVKVKQSRYRPEVPRGFQEVKVPRFHDNGAGWW